MDEARIAREFPDVPEALRPVALLVETLAMAREIELSRRNIHAAGSDEQQIAEIVSASGILEDVEYAQRAVHGTLVEILAKLTERDLESGRDAGILTAEDYREALLAKRKLELARARPSERDSELER